jgi:hypothetical protein
MAMQQAESLPFRLEQAETRRFYAMMLMDRAPQAIAKNCKPSFVKCWRVTPPSECHVFAR